MKTILRHYKNRLLFSIAILCCTAVNAQPTAAYEMMVAGVKVIVQPSTNEIVEIQTIIKGGVQNYTTATQGIESLAMTALTECGTVNDTKNAFKNKLDKVGGSISADAQMDYASINLNCIKSDFDIVWALYADAITKPLFDGKDFARIKQDAINNLKAQESEPDYAIDKMARLTAFTGTDYAKSPEGTTATIPALTAVATKAYYQSILTKSRIFIVVVGEIEKPILEQKIAALLALVPDGKPFVQKKSAFQPKTNAFKAQKTALATNYIEGFASGPAPSATDFNAYTIAMRILNQRHFLEVRSKNGLSYAPGAWFNQGVNSNAALYVTTTEPDKYIAVAKAMVAKAKKEGFTEAEVKNMKTSYITRLFYQQETNSAQAAAFAQNEVLHNNWKRAVTLNEDFKNVSLTDVNNAFKKYFGNISWVYRGDPAKVTSALFTAPENKLPVLPNNTKINKPKD